jgi:hypothetical protein
MLCKYVCTSILLLLLLFVNVWNNNNNLNNMWFIKYDVSSIEITTSANKNVHILSSAHTQYTVVCLYHFHIIIIILRHIHQVRFHCIVKYGLNHGQSYFTEYNNTWYVLYV